MSLEDRFDKEIAVQQFDLLEMLGFKSNPNLAIKAGMAMGYKMALNDVAKQLNERPNVPVPPKPAGGGGWMP